MIRLVVTPRNSANLYGLLVKKEVELRQKNQGTLHRYDYKKEGEERWMHKQYPGWVRFEKCLSGVLVAQINSKAEQGEGQILEAFVGFLNRHFRASISSIHLAYDDEQ